MEDLQSEGDVSHKDDDPFASVPGTLSKFLTGLYNCLLAYDNAIERYAFPISVY